MHSSFLHSKDKLVPADNGVRKQGCTEKKTKLRHDARFQLTPRDGIALSSLQSQGKEIRRLSVWQCPDKAFGAAPKRREWEILHRH